MLPVKEFRKYAGECRQVARNTRDRLSKAAWNQLAERWDRCAALEEERAVSVDQSAKNQRSEGRSIVKHHWQCRREGRLSWRPLSFAATTDPRSNHFFLCMTSRTS
jgi:hypothetical protein